MLTTHEAAKRAKMSRAWIIWMIREKNMPARKFGRDWLIEPEAIDAALASRNKPGRPKK